jgi:hypothetical protein
MGCRARADRNQSLQRYFPPAKAGKPKRVALLEAVRAEQGDRPIDGSWKEANALTGLVNERIKDDKEFEEKKIVPGKS